MTVTEVMLELESLANERLKKLYIGRGAREPLYGVATGAMKPLLRKIKGNQSLAEELYATGNYDAMYLAAMIADPPAMAGADFDRWMDSAYFPMLSDYVVAVTLAEADCAQSVADRWIASGEDLHMSGGWSCYEWLVGWRPDRELDGDKLRAMLAVVEASIHRQPEHTRNAMNRFVIAVGVSYIPLHEEALRTALAMGEVPVSAGAKASLPSAQKAIEKAREKGQLGFKRRAVRC